MRFQYIKCVMILLLAGCNGGSRDAGPQTPIATVAPPANADSTATPTMTGSGGTPAAAGVAANVGTGGTIATPASAGAGGDAAEQSSNAGAGGMLMPPSGLPDVSFTLDINVPAGAEMLKCAYVQFPTNRGVVAVPSAESHYTPGSHHILAYRTDLTSIPSDQAGIFDCGDDFSWMMHNTGSYYEAQQPDARRDLPAGVAHEFQPGEVLILQAHYVNTMTKDLAAHVALTLHTIDPKMVKQEAGSIIFANLDINIPPHSKARMTMTCPIPQDMNLALLWSHMHKRGVSFVATTDDMAASTAAGGALYMEADWSEPKPRSFPAEPPVIIHAGSHITFSCDYQNDGDVTYTYGNSAENNEMCLLHGMYWPRMPGGTIAEQCRMGMSTETQL